MHVKFLTIETWNSFPVFYVVHYDFAKFVTSKDFDFKLKEYKKYNRISPQIECMSSLQKSHGWLFANRTKATILQCLLVYTADFI